MPKYGLVREIELRGPGQICGRDLAVSANKVALGQPALWSEIALVALVARRTSKKLMVLEYEKERDREEEDEEQTSQCILEKREKEEDEEEEDGYS